MGQGEHVPWYYHPVWIALLAIFALGPFALPLVLRTPRLDRRGKTIGGALLAGYTVYLVWGFFRLVAMVKWALLSGMGVGSPL